MQHLRFLVFILSTFFYSASLLANPKVLNTYHTWRAVKEGKEKQKICYIVAEPTTQEGNYSVRNQPYIFVTHDEKAKTFDTFSTMLGYPIKVSSEVKVKIGDKTFLLFTQGNTAWAKDAQTDQAILTALKKGKEVIIEGVSSRETSTKDTYHLKGFHEAYKIISKECSR